MKDLGIELSHHSNNSDNPEIENDSDLSDVVLF